MGDSFCKIENEERRYMHIEYHFALTRFLVSLNSKSCKNGNMTFYFIITWTCLILLSWRAIIWTRLLRAAQVNHSQLLEPFWQSLKKHLECIYTKWSNVYTRGVFTIERALASTRQNLSSGYRGFWRALTSTFSADHASGHVFLTSSRQCCLMTRPLRIEFKMESLSINFSIG